MIYLITGQPGHGKTLRAMQLALDFQAKGRDVYVSGVRGLKAGEAGFLELDDAKSWETLPDGAVVVLDECYSAFPRRMPGAKVPGYVEAMATHRHRGFDFVLICQQAKQQIDGFLLGLVDRHEHVRRRFGLQKSMILSWDKFSENTSDSATKSLWAFPKSVMRRKLYESTVQDTTKRVVPWFVWALPAALLVLGLLVWKVVSWFHPPAPAGAVQSSSLPVVHSLSGAGGGESRRPDNIIKWMTPRVAGQPWTAPAFDQRPVVSEPEVYCIAYEDGRCGCITDQGTRYHMDVKMCRAMVENGGSYNPTRRPTSGRGQSDSVQSREREDTVSASASSPHDSVASSTSGSLNHGSGVGSDYVGPEYRRWDAETVLK